MPLIAGRHDFPLGVRISAEVSNETIRQSGYQGLHFFDLVKQEEMAT
ncbi:hypothetical protein DFR42_10854 [Undibacterium pigrum]|uniref:Uncharacterized protein n=1 Tax=Undibacterium pigrum TaxID=401470 RepID=A0A318J0L4_9BURK|nr:hypothetical protein DFR42_10854 [Undibacterium pigrum]